MTTVCLTFDFDATSLWISTFKQLTATPLSRGEFGAYVGLPRVLELLASEDLSATFFIPAHTAVSFREQTLRIRDAGHEIGVHGYCHETPVGLTKEAEAEILDQSVKKLKRVLGTDFHPFGYRSPAWDLSGSSVELLEDRGFLYDSSMMADDYHPYWARRGFVANEEHYHPGTPTRLLEMPVAWELDDFPHFVFLNKPMYLGMRAPSEVFKIWKGEFDFCHSLGDGVFTLTLHPQVIGRGPRIDMLRNLIQHMKDIPGVVFRAMADEAKQRAEKM
jgi:peptidoglycan/xylan/chitin deacetylase (PgdA/CDA1 family)